ncbi:hypothetical protein D5086_006025 [Populus alba]|uniref:Uncharacterized protein n=1 Tax=Populus alba TaxID=43335 RepID=A0ACC4CKV1_POPAL
MEQVHLFTKKLKPTHISHALSFPTHVLEAFPFPEGAHMTNFEAVDATDNAWRKALLPKTGLSSSWREMTWSGVSFESMSSIMEEKTHKKRPYGSLRMPPIPGLPGFPKNQISA